MKAMKKHHAVSSGNDDLTDLSASLRQITLKIYLSSHDGGQCFHFS